QLIQLIQSFPSAADSKEFAFLNNPPKVRLYDGTPYAFSNCACTLIATLLRSALETGQLCSAACAAFSNAAASTPGTLPRTLRSIERILGPLALSSRVQTASTCSFVTGVPLVARPCGSPIA